MKLTNDKEKVSYIIGEDIGSSLLKEGYDLDVNIMLEAIKAAASGKSENLLSENEKNEVMMRWQQEVNAKKQAAIRRPSSRFDTRRQHFGIRCRTFGHKVVVRRHQNGISHSQFRAGRHAIWQRQCKKPRRSTKPSG